jgi:hypothetical protein
MTDEKKLLTQVNQPSANFFRCFVVLVVVEGPLKQADREEREDQKNHTRKCPWKQILAEYPQD